MRLDLFLKASRLSLRRSIAQKLCDAGLVFVNDKVAKSAHAVKMGDKITLRRHGKITDLRVLSLPEGKQTSRHDAPSLYQILTEREELE